MDFKNLREQMKNKKTFSTILPSLNIEVFGKPYTLDDEITVSGLMELENLSMFYAGVANLLMDKYSLSPDVVNSLTTIDIMWLVAQLKKVSDGNLIKITFECPHCKTNLNAEINIDEIKIKNVDKFQKIYDVSDTLKIEVGVPYFGDYFELIKDFKKEDKNNVAKLTKQNIDMFKYSIKKFYIGDKVEEIDHKRRYSDDFDKFIKEELRETYKLFKLYLDKEVPEIDYSKKIVCAKCKKDIELDISDFFYSML